MKNSLVSIIIYKYGESWVFDDVFAGLNKEPFVAGADDLCEIFADGRDKFTCIFSDISFPGYEYELKYLNGYIKSGTYYSCLEKGIQNLWLCPALGKYFKDSPETIYLKIK